MKKKILICGATGFIGRNMAEFFAANDNFEVYGTYWNSVPLQHPKINMVKVDLIHPDSVRKVVEGMDIVIQAAATTSGAKDTIHRPYFHVTDNAVMNSLIFRFAFESRVSHVVFFGCTTMYYSSDIPVRETDFDANRGVPSAYFGVAWTKVYLEKMCEFYAGLGQTKFTVIRHSNIYGPYDKFDLERSHVFGATMTKVMSAKDVGAIVVWGTGEETRDLLYVSDLVEFIDCALKKQNTPFELVNIGCGYAVSVNELVQKIIQHSGKTITVRHDTTKPTIPTKLCLDITKAKELFGWSPRVTLKDGIERTMQWYRKNIESVEAIPKRFSKNFSPKEPSRL